MLRFKNSEMSAVNRQNPFDFQAFRHRKNTSVNQINMVVVVFLQNFGGAFQIIFSCANEFKFSFGYFPQKCG